VFVVFRPAREHFDPVISVSRDGQSVLSQPLVSSHLVVTKAVYGVPGDAARTRDVTAKVQAIVAGGERRFTGWRLGEGDDPAMQTLKSLKIDYILDGKPRTTTVLDGQTACLEDVNTIDPPPTARTQRAANGDVMLEAWQNGMYELKTASGRKLRCKLDGISPAQRIEGPWTVCFPTNAGEVGSVKLDKLISWSESADFGVKYFSGTATYQTTFRISPEALAAGHAVYIDLGKVAVIAHVSLNGRDLGILWKSPFRVEATQALHPGENLLEVKVANLWPNRMIGDAQLPEDSERDPNGQLKSWPKWLMEGKPSPSGRHTFATYNVWKKDSPLQESGLLGPVTLQTVARITVQ